MERLTPPPIRRIVLDAEPTVVRASAALLQPRRRSEQRGRARRPRSAGACLGPQRPARRRTTSRPGPERMRAEELSIAYAGKPAVDSVTLPVRQGEVLALIGPSGCGKTTLAALAQPARRAHADGFARRA